MEQNKVRDITTEDLGNNQEYGKLLGKQKDFFDAHVDDINDWAEKVYQDYLKDPNKNNISFDDYFDSHIDNEVDGVSQSILTNIKSETFQRVVKEISFELNELKTDIMLIDNYQIEQKYNKETKDLTFDSEGALKEGEEKEIGKSEMKELMIFLNGNKGLSSTDKKLITSFMETISDIESEDENVKNNVNNLEKTILDYIAQNPEEAIKNTRAEWINVLKEKGVTVKSYNKFERFFGESGTKDLQKIAQAYVAAKDVNGVRELSGFARFADLVREKGSFENAYSAYNVDMKLNEMLESVAKNREDRFALLMNTNYKKASRYEEKNGDSWEVKDPDIDTQINMLCDFNLDGNVNY